MNYDEIIDNNFNEFYWDIINSRTAYLRNENNEYKSMFLRQCNITKNKNIENFLDNKNVEELNKDDLILLLEYIELLEQMHSIELKDLFKITLALSKKINEKINNIISDYE